jgi:hypothetical protein
MILTIQHSYFVYELWELAKGMIVAVFRGLAMVKKEVQKWGLRADQRGYVRGNLVVFYGIREMGWVLRAQKGAWGEVRRRGIEFDVSQGNGN